MRAGHSGRIAISWTQTELDGLEAAPQSFLKVGAAWSWRGQAHSLTESSPHSLALSGQAQEITEKMLKSLVPSLEVADGAMAVVVLTNGAQTFTGHLYLVTGEADPVLVFEDGCPARDQEFWIGAYTEFENQSDSIQLDRTVVAFPTRARSDGDWEKSVDRPAVRARTMAD
ncbi:hypothetical protein [Ruegeria sp. Ofav3-42]|uniref:hypothetical protein n=1 Tax=Ruegeria sp. Ofav3-42 TaxID=2917759 RepID=UPI001EF535A7|nr:hypothetical protein [Ruegeria sp. Ofav3-42]MCG7519452.1 hypothetical protein [Ruegeria sp. Ofav3-42]